MLSKYELIKGYTKIFGNNTAEEAEKIFNKVDADKSGQIDYSEWVVATIDKKKLLTRDKLKAAFSLFDKDDSGTISTKELKELLCDG
jgi:calcium-dependent protein kinase